MKKHVLKKSMVLGSLMAFVITGSALAANVDVANGVTKNEPVIAVGTNESFKNAGTVVASESITVTGAFTNTGEIQTKKLDITQHSHAGTIIGGKKIVATESFVYRGTNDSYYTNPLTADVHTKLLHIIGSTTNNQTGFLVTDNEVLDDVENIIIESKGGKTGSSFTGNDLNITSNITLKGAGDARLEVTDDSNVSFGKVTSESSKGKIQANGNSKVSVAELNVESGELTLQTNGKEDSVGKFVLGNINLAENGKLYACTDNEWAKPKMEISGDININLAKNAVVDFGANKILKPDWDGTKINVNADSLTVHVADTSSDSKVYISNNSDIVKNNSEKIVIIADGANNTGNAAEDLKSAGNVLQFTDDSNGSDAIPTTSAGVGATVEQEASTIFDGASGSIAEKGKIENIQIKRNTNVYGILDTTTNALMTWRQENNDMNKRLGELRDSNGQHGVWVRMVRGQADYNSIDNQYNTYQLGYDEKLSTNPEWTVGAAVSYTDGSSDFASGSGENTHKSIAFYGSKLSEDGSFVDLIAKYGRLEHEFNVAEDTLSGEYATNGYSVSAEYGKRFEKENGFWIEPQVELTYGRVTEADYVNKQGNKVVQEDMDSLVGRLGFRLGRDIKQGNVYVRASYLYDFDGETAVSFTDSEGHKRVMEADLGGGWFEVGVGTNYNLSDATYLYFDVEKTYGGDVATPWQWNAGVRYSF